MVKPLKIAAFIEPGEIGDATMKTTTGLLAGAARAMGRAGADAICGPVLFRDHHGKFHVGTLEFVISEADPKFVVDTLAGAFAECADCRHIEKISALDAVVDYQERVDHPTTHPPPGQCTVCGALSYEISRTEARQIVSGTRS